MSFIQNLFTSRDNNANAATYVGQQDRIWWNPDTNAFYYSNGNTPGGIPIGTATGNGIPLGPINSVQLNAGNGSFLGSSNLTFANNVLTVNGNVTANYFIGDGSQITNLPGFSLGNLYVIDQTIYGNNINANIGLSPEGDGWVTVPKIDISGMTVANTGTAVQFDTDAGINIQFGPGAGGNILTAGTIKPTSNNIAGLGASGSRYTDLWLGSGNINLIDQTLNQNQQIYADNGNLIFANADGIKFGQFEIYGNTISTINPAANILIGLLTDTAYVEINRPLTVNSTGGGGIAFQVEQDGTTQINVPTGIPANTAGALNIVASADGAYQNVTNSGGMLHLTGPENSASRITVDAYGSQGGTGATSALVLRSARGNASTPTATQANDITGRVSSIGWGTTFGPSVGGLAPTAMEFVALENYTDTAQGSKITFNTANIGANVRSVSATIQANGVSFLNNSIANSGITFNDGSFQNTAYSPTNSVSSLVAGAGINLSAPTGDITVTNTGILGVIGTPNRVTVASNVGGVVTLTTPQDLNTTANMTLYSLTVTNLSITGNVSNVIPSIVDGPVIYVANTATTYNDINNSGLITGNIANNFSAGILYKTASNTWNFDYGNSWGITANTVYGNTAFFQDFMHVGYANATVEYGNASIQADSNIDDFSQIVQQNHNQGASASADFVAVANNGDDGNFYIDMGINSNVYNNNDYAVTGANDGYLYVNGGNLAIGTQTAAKVINFFTGGTSNTQNFIRGTVSDTGLSMVGNVTANNFIGNTVSAATISGTSITGTTLSVTGVVTGSSITGSVVSATGTITGGNLRTGGTISATGNVTAGNLVTATTVVNSGVSTSGNITAANISGTNITASGTISAIGNISTPNLNASIAIVSTLLSITGNIDGGNLRTDGLISTTGNATFGNVQTVGRVSVTGNIDSSNVRTTGIVTATGNISTAGFFLGNGSQLTGIATNAFTTVAANGTNLSYATNSGILTLTPGTNMVITGNASAAAANIAVNYNPTFGNVSVVGNITVSGNILTANTSYLANVGNILFSNVAPLGTAYPGVMEFDGRVLYFTGQDQERGIVPNQQWYVLNTDRGLTYASTTPQSLFGVGVHVSNSTRYWFRIKATVSRSSGTNNTAFTLGWRGTATPGTITYLVDSSIGTVSTVKTSYQYEAELVANFTNQVAVTTTSNPPDSVTVVITGIIDVGAAGVGYLDPYISWTGAAAPGSVTVESLSSFQIYPIGVTGINTNVGNWA